MQTSYRPHTAYTQCTYATLSSRISDLKPIINWGAAGMRKIFYSLHFTAHLVRVTAGLACSPRNCEWYLSLSITFFMWEFGMSCLNLFVFCYCDTPVICSDDTRYAGDTRGLTQDNGGPIHELQIAAFPPCTHCMLHCSGIYGGDKIMQSFQTNNHCPRRMISEYLFLGRGSTYWN